MKIQLPNFSRAPIDIHTHFNHGSEYDAIQPEFDNINGNSLEFLKTMEYDSLGIGCGGFSSYASVLSSENVVEENENMHSLALKEEWIYQWVVIDPRKEETFRQAEEMLKSPKCLGIKIHPDCHGYDIEEYGDILFEFANRHKAVMLMHPMKILKMPYFADKYPDMKLIIAHLGSNEHIEAIKNAKYGNIYTDTSGGLSYLNNVLEYAVEQVGSEKILFGTDTYSCAFQYGRVVLSRLSAEDKENIMYRNAISLFPKAFG